MNRAKMKVSGPLLAGTPNDLMGRFVWACAAMPLAHLVLAVIGYAGHRVY